jgi:hypothetical protein
MKNFRNLGLKLVILLVLIISAFFIYSNISKAQEGRKDPGQIEADLFINRENVVIDDDVYGDLHIVGSKVEINQQVKGNAFVIGQDVTVNGRIDGSLIVIASNEAKIQAQVAQNIYAIGKNINITKWSNIEGRAYLLGQNAIVDGNLKGRVYGQVTKFVLNNEINNSVWLKTNDIQFGDNGKINQSLYYSSGHEIEIPQEKVLGKIEYKPSYTTGSYLRNLMLPDFSVYSFIISLFSLFVLGLIIVSFWPKVVNKAYDYYKLKSFKAFIIGLFFLILVPIVLFVLIVTVIGIQAGIILGLLAIILVLLSKSVFSVMLGMLILDNIHAKKQMAPNHKMNLLHAMIIGVIAYTVLVFVPLIGIIVKIIAILSGVGLMVMLLKSTINNR